MKESVLTLILQAGYIVKGVLFILLSFSIVSWAIIFFKQRYFSKANKESEQFLRAFRANKDPRNLYKATRNISMSPIANVFKYVYTDESGRDPNEVKRLLRRYET